jgi:hypothetical protein
MKKLFYSIAITSMLFFSQTVNAQINLEHTFDGWVNNYGGYFLPPSLEYYTDFNAVTKQMRVYNEDYSLHKSISFTPPAGYSANSVSVYKNIFTTDGKLTFLVTFNNPNQINTNSYCALRLYDENGAMLKDFGYMYLNTHGTHVTSDKKYRFLLIRYIYSPATTTHKTEIYSVPGIPPLAPTITTITLPSGTVGTVYNQTLIANGDAPITWGISNGNLPNGLNLSSSGEISGIPTTAETANFTVKANNNTGSDTKELSIFIDEETGISGLQLAEIKIFPNPANDKLIVDCENNLQNRIIFYDMTGKEVLNQNITGKTEINISNLQKGIYIVSIMSESEVVGNFKVVKQ